MPKFTVDFDTPPVPNEGESLLHVVFHGLVSLVDARDHFQAILLDMGTEHAYFGGTWLAEREVPPHSIGTLKGVRPGNAELIGSENPVLSVQQLPTTDHPNVHGILVLPRPRAIHYLNRGLIEITGGSIDRVLGPTKTLAAVRVFEYEIENSYDAVWIDGLGLNWVCRENFTTYENKSRVASLHIIDAPFGPVSDTHHVDEFSISSRALGAPIRIDSAIPIDIPNPAMPPGLPELELANLDTREAEISDLFEDFLRKGEYIPRGVVAGGCRPCCGAVDGRIR